MQTTLATRFWGKVLRGDNTSCWAWSGSRDAHGYGRIYGWHHRDGSKRVMRAHRVAWELFNGPIPTGMHICHHCDNTQCCNPSHLFLGTPADNSSDKVAKGRQSRGPARSATTRGRMNGNAKLTDAAVRRIRERVSAGESRVSIARSLGVDATTVSLVALRKRWGHV